MKARVPFVACVALLALPQCRAQPSPSAPDATTKAPSAEPAWPDWSTRAAIATCDAAVARARNEPPELEKSRALMAACASLVGGPECRAVTVKQWSAEPAPTFFDVVTVCASEYCPRLADAEQLAACRFKEPDPTFVPAEAWVSLRRSMLIHDFPESERPNVARVVLLAMEYVRSVPPPSFRVGDSPPEVEVHLKPDGALTVVQDGEELATVGSVEELATVLPKPSPGARAAVRVAPETEYGRVIALIDALRSAGFDHVSFAPRP